MAMRDLVTGSGNCDPSSSSSNPLGSLVNTLVGSSSKTQERLKEIPTAASSAADSQFYPHHDAALPGSETDFLPNQQLPSAQASGFLQNYHAATHGGFTEAWDDIQFAQRDANIPVYNEGIAPQTQPSWDGPPQKILSGFLHSFIGSSHFGAPFRPTALPMLGLTKGDKQCIRNRSSIMARHFFADKSDDFINAQVDALLHSLDIDNDMQMKGPLPGMGREMENYWNESQGIHAPVADRWAAEFGQHKPEPFSANGWVSSFEREHGPNGWASEFEHEQSQMVLNQPSSQHMSRLAAMEQTRMLAHTLSQNNDPKFQNSRFLQFLSKMSRGELFVEGNEVKENQSSVSGDWAAEFQNHHDMGVNWANQFSEESSDRWVNEFDTGSRQDLRFDDKWVDEFSKLNVQDGVGDWVGEFEHQAEGAFDANTESWASAYDEYLNEQSAAKNN